MLDSEDDIMDAEEDLTLEGILNNLLDEDSGKEESRHDSENADADRRRARHLEDDADEDDSKVRKENKARRRRKSVAKENALVQEVLKRIRTRLRSLAKK